MPNFIQNRPYKTAVYFNDKRGFIIQTRSERRIDHLYAPHFLPADADNESIGKALINALSHSRDFDPDSSEYEEFMDLDKGKQRVEDWLQGLYRHFGIKTKTTLFKHMKLSDVILFNDQISIDSSRHVKLTAWEGMGVEDVVLSVDSSFEEIGAGVRLALSRCIG